MVIGALSKQSPTRAEETRQRFVGVKYLQARHIGHLLQEPPRVIDGDHDRDSRFGAGDLVILTIGRCLVDDAGALPCGDILCDQNLPRVLETPGFPVRVIVKDSFVVDSPQLRAWDASRDGSRRVCDLGIAELLAIVDDGVLREEVGGARVDGVWPGRDQGIGDFWPDRESSVRGKCPRGGRPGQSQYSLQLGSLSLLTAKRERHCYRLVLTWFVDVIIHPQLVVTQRGLIPPAIGQNPVTLISETFVVKLLEGPNDALHKGDVESLVIVLKVNPSSLTGHILLPLLGVTQNGVFRGLVEGCDSHLLDLALVGDAQLTLRFELGWQPVSVPAKTSVNLLAPHGVEARENVFGVPGEEVTIVGQPVGKGWSVIEDPLVASLALINGLLKGVSCFPVRKNPVLNLRKGRTGFHRGTRKVTGESHGVISLTRVG